jgi:hypothetical protein
MISGQQLKIFNGFLILNQHAHQHHRNLHLQNLLQITVDQFVEISNLESYKHHFKFVFQNYLSF